MDVYSLTDTIPLSFSRIRNSALVSGLTVTVTVVNVKTNATLLASTLMPEVSTSGIYVYNWTHGQAQDTECLIKYSVGTNNYYEQIFITNDAVGGDAH